MAGVVAGVDQAVEQLEQLYRSVTGRTLGPEPVTTIPPERDPVRHVQDQIERLLQVLGASGGTVTPNLATWMPRIALWETSRELLIRFELAGVPRDSVKLAVARDYLVVSGWRPLPTATAEAPTLRHSELATGPFTRSVPLPFATSPAEVTAHLRDGILDVRVRRLPGAGPAAAPAFENVAIK